MTSPDPRHDGATQRILVTGAAGRMGRMLRRWLPRKNRELRYLDIVPVDEPGAITASVSDPAAIAAACEGVDAVVHLGGTPADADWNDLRDTNIHGTYCVFEAARQAGASRIVYASSNHAVGFQASSPELPDDLPVRPDTMYGVTKVFGEALGSLYHDRFGLDVVCLRIGTCYDVPPSDLRSLSTWLSPRDCARLVDAALTCPAPGFRTVWGISRNSRRTWSLDGGAAIDYHPEDDAEEFAADAVTREAEYEEAVRRHVGGAFAL